MRRQGEVFVSEEDKAEVRRLHALLCEYCTKQGAIDMPTMGFYTVVGGDYETSEHGEYIPE